MQLKTYWISPLVLWHGEGATAPPQKNGCPKFVHFGTIWGKIALLGTHEVEGLKHSVLLVATGKKVQKGVDFFKNYIFIS